LSSLTSGRATYTMRYSDYALCPPDIQDKLISSYEADQDDE